MKQFGFTLLLFISIFSFSQTYKKTTTTRTVKTVTKTATKKPTSTYSKIPKDVQVWIVDAQRAKCEGAETRMCLLVKKPGDKDFNLFYSDIDGFNYKEGYVYKLWVKVEHLETMTLMIGESGTKYTLVKIVSKKEIPGYANTNVPNKKPMSGMNVSMTKTFIVNEEKVPCEGNPDSKCLLIKKEGAKTFEIFYQNIEGFTFDPGYRQTITVNERHVANPMVKQVAPIYSLVEVIKKEWVGAAKIDPVISLVSNNPLDKKWILRKMKDTDTSSFLIDDNVVYMEISSAENRLTGKAPCNTFVGGLKTDLLSSFSASAIVNTKMYCNNMKMEDLFFTLLQNAERFEIIDKKLSLYKGDRLLLVFE